MREQWSTDEGRAHSEQHRRDLIHHFRQARAELDAFRPDFVLLWGDDQYENYREDCVPPFSVLAYESVDVQPWKGHRRGENWWDEPEDKTFTIRAIGRAPRRWSRRCWARGSTSPTPTSPCTRGSATPS